MTKKESILIPSMYRCFPSIYVTQNPDLKEYVINQYCKTYEEKNALAHYLASKNFPLHEIGKAFSDDTFRSDQAYTQLTVRMRDEHKKLLATDKRKMASKKIKMVNGKNI